jgi:hypothetical protein
MNNSGSAVVALVAVVPLLLTLATALVAVLLSLYAQQIALHTCRAELLQVQSEFADPLNQLLNLNPQAVRLHREYVVAKRAAAANPAAAAFVAAVVARMLILKGRQLKLSAQMSLVPAAHLARLPSDLRHEFQMRLQSPYAVHDDMPFSPAPALRYQVLDEILGTYHTLPRFEQLQTRELRWQIELSQLLPKVIAPLFQQLSPLPLAVHGRCAATVYLKGQKWTATLAATPAKL